MIYSLEDLKQEKQQEITITIDKQVFTKKVAWNTAEDIKNIIGADRYVAVSFYETQYSNAKKEEHKLNALVNLENAKSNLGMGIIKMRKVIVEYFFGEEFGQLFSQFPEEVQIQITLDAMGQLQKPSRA